MFAFMLLFLKGLIVGACDDPPTAEEIQAFEDAEDECGYYGQWPSPTERYEWAVEWHEGMVALPLSILLRWRLAVAWMPFCESERRLIGKRLSDRLFPSWSQMHPRRIKARA